MRILFSQENKTIEIFLSGDYLRYDNQTEKVKLFRLLSHNDIQKVVFEDDSLNQWDSSLLLILYQTKKICLSKKIQIDLTKLPKQLQQLTDLAFFVDQKPPQERRKKLPFLEKIGTKALLYQRSFLNGWIFVNQTISSFARWFKAKAIMRKIDFYFALDNCGPKAIGIVSLISFMVGLILAFVGAIQLETFGAQIYIASLVTIGMIRIMGAIMTGIIMAGRTGASYAANIGTMQVNEEIDALKTMGIPINDFLVLPRLMALTLSMPILTVLSDFMGMLGGGFVGIFLLGLPFHEYLQFSIEAFGLTNFLVGLFHSFVFGLVIALCGCYYGVNCGKDADSVGKATTSAVVSAIVWMIVMTGIITLIFQVLGI